jgi:hypothetical protein
LQRCSRPGRRTCPIRSNQPRQNSNAMLKVTDEQIGQAKLPAQPLVDRSAGSAFEAGAGLLWDEQNCPPTPLSARPIVCPCAKPQASTLNRTQKYNVQAMSERSERVSFMAATLPPNNWSIEAQPGTAVHRPHAFQGVIDWRSTSSLQNQCVHRYSSVWSTWARPLGVYWGLTLRCAITGERHPPRLTERDNAACHFVPIRPAEKSLTSKQIGKNPRIALSGLTITC